MKVVRIEAVKVRLQLRKPFRHALCNRTETENVIVRVELADGTVGWGEGVPRDYVTGETSDTTYDAVCVSFAPMLLGIRWKTWESLREFLISQTLARWNGGAAAARCAVELALLDAGGKHFRRSAVDFLGGRHRRWVRYSIGVSADSLDELRRRLRRYRLLGLRRVKLKLGADGADVARVALARTVLGRNAAIAVDVNGAWTPDEAVRKLRALAVYDVEFVEEPTRPGDLEALAAVAAESPIPLSADESLRTEEEGRQLVARRACHIFNLRLSKCGGITGCMRLAELARRHRLRVSVGCNVGESGILSAAGRHLLLSLGDALWAEGSYGTFLLKDDLTRPSVRFGWAGIGGALRGPGLGVDVDSTQMDRHLLAAECVA
jgi:L-alanine-DL-glutamate epimerase-like enolase superfamily enzyme